MSDPIDLGFGVRVELHRLHGALRSITYWHPCVTGSDRASWVPLRPHNPHGWDVLTETPLTLSPALVCRACGLRGVVRNGAWQPSTEIKKT